MPLVVFLRGVNVGGHKTFRPSLLVRELSDHDVVNIGAAGTFVVRKPGSRTKFVAELRDRLPVQSNIICCDAADLLRIANNNPFTQPAQADVVRFVSIFAKTTSARPSLPLQLPANGDWLVRVLASDGQFVFGEYRRHMKTIGYLGQLDKLFKDQATTRNWNTIATIVKTLTTPRKP
jgi:uncharacterized protein (DUF1697 family)